MHFEWNDNVRTLLKGVLQAAFPVLVIFHVVGENEFSGVEVAQIVFFVDMALLLLFAAFKKGQQPGPGVPINTNVTVTTTAGAEPSVIETPPRRPRGRPRKNPPAPAPVSEEE